VVLYRSSDVYRLLVSPFRIIVISPRLDSLAGTAEGSRRRPSIQGKGATHE